MITCSAAGFEYQYTGNGTWPRASCWGACKAAMVSSACWRACVSSRISSSSSSILRRRRPISSSAPSRATVRGDGVIDCSSRRSCPSALDQANASAAMVPAQSATTASMTSRRTTLLRRRRTTAAGSGPNSSSNVSSFGISAVCNGSDISNCAPTGFRLRPMMRPRDQHLKLRQRAASSRSTGRWSLIECNARNSGDRQKPDHDLRAEGRRHLRAIADLSAPTSSSKTLCQTRPFIHFTAIYRSCTVGDHRVADCACHVSSGDLPHGQRYCEMVQPNQGLRVHSAARWRQGRLRPYFSGGESRPLYSQ